MTTYTDLITALQEATGPSREMDARIWCLFKGYKFISYHLNTQDPFVGDTCVYREPGSNDEEDERHFPRFTASLDAITALIERELPGWYGDVDFGRTPVEDGLLNARLWGTRNERWARASHARKEIALCIAFLEARKAQEEAHG